MLKYSMKIHNTLILTLLSHLLAWGFPGNPGDILGNPGPCRLRISHLTSGPGNPGDVQEVWDSADLGSLTLLVGLGILGTSEEVWDSADLGSLTLLVGLGILGMSKEVWDFAELHIHRISHLSSGRGNPGDVQEVWDSADLGSLNLPVGLGIQGCPGKSRTLQT